MKISHEHAIALYLCQHQRYHIERDWVQGKFVGIKNILHSKVMALKDNISLENLIIVYVAGHRLNVTLFSRY